MTSSTGPLFELTFSVEHDLADPLRHWLADLAQRCGDNRDILDSRLFQARAAGPELAAWTLQLQCRDDSTSGTLCDGFFADTEAAVAEEFGDAVHVASRTLREEHLPELLPGGSPDCLNCGTRLRGQYCGICGQRARSRLISLWELISDAFGDLLELDSRLWRTVVPLVRRPGLLTRDYLEGRRARYMPPFRSYLVLSLIFFIVAFFDPREDLGLLFEPVAEPTAEELAEKARAAETAKREVLKELADEGIIVGDSLPGEAADTLPETPAKGASGLNIQFDDDDSDCDIDVGDLDDMPAWFQKRFTPERLKQVCKRVTADKGKAFLGLLRDNIPVALIVLLPLMALVLKVLYPLSRRYFVEHLLFVVHFHAFFFLILTLQILFARFSAWVNLPQAIAPLATVAVLLYIPVYLYLAMRHVYGQGRILTFVKYVALVVSYGVGATLTMLGAALFALVAV